MGANKSKSLKRKKRATTYLCPHCGNPAPFRFYGDRPIYCNFCHRTYDKSERVLEKDY